MGIDSRIADRIANLIDEARSLSRGNEYDAVRSPQHEAQCRGWLSAAANIVEVLLPSPDSAYRRNLERVISRQHGYLINRAVAEAASILESLLEDARRGLIASIASQARAEVLDDFLDDAEAYLKKNGKDQAGVIAGAVFEDAIRRACRDRGLREAGSKLDVLIQDLVRSGVLSELKAKRARAAAGMRTSAAHARWEEFDHRDVATTIAFTREFIETQLDGPEV